MKGLLLMTSKEMASVFLQNHSDSFDHLSSPLYYHEDGPYLIALTTESTPPTLFLYEFLDLETCMEKPQEIPAAFMDFDYLTKAIATLNLQNNEASLGKAVYELQKIVPFTFAYKQYAQKICRDCPGVASEIFFMTESGKLASAFCLLSGYKNLN